MANTVLVVDDVAFVRKTLTDIFTQGHYRVVGEASDGQEAFAMYEKLRPDLVTLDVVMPNVSGIEATRKIVKADPNAKIIIITAMGQENLIMEAINAGAKDYILKPFKPADVLRAAERALMDITARAVRVPTRETKGL